MLICVSKVFCFFMKTNNYCKINSVETLDYLFKSSTDGVLGVDTKTKKFIFANPGICKILEYSCEEILKMKIGDIHTRSVQTRVSEEFSNLVKGKKKIIESLPVLMKSRKIIYCDISATVVDIDNKKIALGFFRDVTAKIEAQKELKQSRDYFKTLNNSLSEAIFIVKLPEREIEYANKTLKKVLGYKPEEVLGRKTSFLYSTKKDFLIFGAALKNAIKNKRKSFVLEHKLKRKNGEIIVSETSVTFLKEKDRIVRVISVVKDITQKKKTEENLRRSQEKYKTIFNTTPNLLVLLNKNGNVLSVNKRAFDLLGHKPEDLVGKNLFSFDFLSRKNKNKVKEAIKNKFSGKNIEPYELEFLDRNNEERVGLIRGSIFEDENGIYDLVVISDITKRKKIEASLIKSERKLNSIISSMQDFIFLLDKDLRFIDFYSQNENFFYVSSDKFLGKKFDEVMPKDYVKNIKPILNRVLKTQKAETFEYPLVVRGEEFYFKATVSVRRNIEGKVEGLLQVVSDITAKKKAQNDLKKSEEKLRSIIEHSSEMFYIHNVDHVLQYVSPQSKDILGYTPEEMIRKWTDLTTNKPINLKGFKLTQEAIKTGKKQDVYLLELRKKDGSKIMVEIDESPVENEKGKVIAISGALKDVTEREKLNQMKSDFIAIASHQLRTPLAEVNWLAEVLLAKKTGELNEEQKKIVNQIHDSNNKLVDLSRDLLDLSNLESGRMLKVKKRRQNLVLVFDEIIEKIMLLSLDSNVKVLKSNDFPKKCMVSFDKEKLTRAILNIVRNAIEYSKKGGKVKIGLKEKNNKEVVFYIKDRGIGIPKDQQNKVYDRFFRAKNALIKNPNGTGLGLTIANNIINEHSGRLWFESNEKGTVFYFSLPK